MHAFIVVIQIIIAIAVVVLLAVQTDKAEQGGVMGLGAAGGRSASDIDMEVGPERILKPLTKWLAIGFLFISMLSAIKTITVFHFVGILVLYFVVMLYGDQIWRSVLGIRR